MPDANVQEAYRDAGPLVHTLGLRMLGSVEEAEALVRRVFAATVASASPLERRALVSAATSRVADELSAQARARLGDVQGTIEGFAQTIAVEAEAERLLLRAAVDALAPVRRDVIERVLVHGDDVFEFALMTGMSEAEAIDELAGALVELWDGYVPVPPHAPLAETATRVLGVPGDARWDPHLAACEACLSAQRRMSDLVAAVSRLPATGPVVTPRPGLWADVEAAIAGREGCGDDARARSATAGPSRRRRVVGTAIGIVVLIAIGLAVVLVERIAVGDTDDVVAATVLTDPRTGADAGTASIIERDGARVLVVQGPFVEAAGSFYELWLVHDDGTRLSLGPILGARDETTLPSVSGEAVASVIEVTREPWDGDADTSGDVVARGTLR